MRSYENRSEIGAQRGSLDEEVDDVRLGGGRGAAQQRQQQGCQHARRPDFRMRSELPALPG